MKYYVDTEGKYLGGWDENPPVGSIEVPCAPDDASQLWLGTGWAPVVLTDEEMKASEIEQDKAFLASTDWIIAKIGEASFTGQDTKPLIDQYAEQLQSREIARIRIRISEGLA